MMPAFGVNLQSKSRDSMLCVAFAYFDKNESNDVWRAFFEHMKLAGLFRDRKCVSVIADGRVGLDDIINNHQFEGGTKCVYARSLPSH